MKISIIDTETTGLDVNNGELIEVAVCNFDCLLNEIIDSKSFLVKNTNIQDVENTRHIHGISSYLVEKYGHPYESAQLFLENEIKNSEAILAHNSEFDKQWFTNNVILEKTWVCTCDDVKWPNETQSKSLVAIALAHGVGVVSAHRALDDVLTLARLLKRVGESHDLTELMRLAMRPKAKFKAIVSYDNREKAKQAGFRWDGESKSWWRNMAIDDAKLLDFESVQI